MFLFMQSNILDTILLQHLHYILQLVTLHRSTQEDACCVSFGGVRLLCVTLPRPSAACLPSQMMRHALQCCGLLTCRCSEPRRLSPPSCATFSSKAASTSQAARCSFAVFEGIPSRSGWSDSDPHRVCLACPYLVLHNNCHYCLYSSTFYNNNNKRNNNNNSIVWYNLQICFSARIGDVRARPLVSLIAECKASPRHRGTPQRLYHIHIYIYIYKHDIIVCIYTYIYI